MSDSIRIRKPDDFHLHLRQEEMLKKVVVYSSTVFARALVMPNISPSVVNAMDMVEYKSTITETAGPGFTPLMTFKLRPSLSGKTIEELAEAGVTAGKYYPAGATTNSTDAISRWDQCLEALETMDSLGIPLSIHGEDPDAPALEREQAFLPVLDQIRNRFPGLPLIFEHISSKEGVEWVNAQDEKVAATVTLHHLMLTIENIIGGALRPHLFCRPLPKTERDRQAVEDLVLSGFPRVFFGSDSAPHSRNKKEASGGAAGIFTAPVLMPLLAEFFEKKGALDQLEPFVSEKGADFYGLPRNEGKLLLKKSTKTVPAECGGVVPFYAGRSLSWEVVKEDH